MVDVAAGATPAAQLRDGSAFVALLDETFRKLAEAHAAELRRVQLGGALWTSGSNGDTAVHEALAEAVHAMVPDDVPAADVPVDTVRSMGVPAKLMPAVEAPANLPPQLALGTTPCLEDVTAADGTRASNGGQGGEGAIVVLGAATPLSSCKSDSPPEDSEGKMSEQTGNAMPKADAQAALSQKANGSNITLHAIEINITSAGDLRDADLMLGAGTSDPYCVCQIKGKPDTRFQTHVINDDCHPVWNYETVIADFEEGDVLSFMVYDSDPGIKDDDLLGWVDMESLVHFPQGFDGTLSLQVPKKYSVGDQSTLSVKVVPRDCVVERDDDRALAALQLKLDAGKQLWPELPDDERVELQLHRSNMSSSSLDVKTFQMHRARSIVHGTTIMGRGRLERALVFNPYSSSQACWDICSVACVLFDIYRSPFVLAFEVEPILMRYASTLTTIFWTLDLVRSCFCGYYHNGIIEMRLRRILTRYLRSWFVFEFLLVALDWVSLLMPAAPSTFLPKMLRALHLLRAARAVSIIRLVRVMGRVERISYGVRGEAKRAILFLVSFMVILLLGCHLLACGFYRLGLVTSRHGTPGWVLRDEVDAQGWVYSYITSVHWAFTQFMPASSGVNPANTYDRGYALLVDIMGFVCFSFFVSNVQMLLQGFKNKSADSHRRNALLRRFFKEHNISNSLSHTIMHYVSNANAAAKKRLPRESDVQVLATLPRAMHEQLHFEMYGAVVQAHPFFLGLLDIDTICFRRLCHGAMTELALECGEEVFIRGGKAHSMYFITSGHMLYKRPGLSFNLSVGGWACEPVLWFPSWTHRGNLHTLGATDLVQVCAATFAALVFAVHATTVRKAYVHMYAAAFVRGGESEIPTLQHSDVWSNAESIDELVSECTRRAGFVNESQIVGIWREPSHN